MDVQVSIITPCYNAVNTVGQTIQSVICQSYPFWEMIIVDDCSSDGSDQVIKSYCEKDARIKYLMTDTPSGSPVLPRNLGIASAEGRFIAFLDSDDLWLPAKLEKQLPLFEDENVAVVFSNYEKINQEGQRSGREITAPASIFYRDLLNGNVIGCLTAVYDTMKVGKMYFDRIGHEDYVFWLSVLKKGFVARNANMVLALYRVRSSSLSSNKLKALSWTWHIYRKVEQLSFTESCYYFFRYALYTGLKYLK